MKHSLYNERKYLLLRSKLDQLHYSLPLQIESAELVDQLLNDYIKTSEGFQKLKKQNEELEAQLNLHDKSLIPLEQENKKLLRENNQLHQDIIVVKENAIQREHLSMIKLKSLESETKDLKFVIQQSEQRMRKLEDQNLALKNKHDTIVSKVYIPSSEKGFDDLIKPYQNANTRSPVNISISKSNKSGPSTLLQKRAEVQGEEAWLRQSQDNSNEEGQSHLQKIRELQNKIKELEAEVEKSEAASNFLKNQVDNRDREIKRLYTRLDSKFKGIRIGGLNKERLALHYQQTQQNEKIELLGNQIDFLNKENEKYNSTFRSQKTLQQMSEVNLNLQAENQSLLQKLSIANSNTLNAEKKLEVNRISSGQYRQSFQQ